jgi:hypothetical protein
MLRFRAVGQTQRPEDQLATVISEAERWDDAGTG